MSDASSHRDVRYPPGGKGYPIALAAVGVNEALAVISGRWKSEILALSKIEWVKRVCLTAFPHAD